MPAPTANTLLLILALPVLFIAINLAPTVLPKLQQFFPPRNDARVYCYASVTTLDPADPLDGAAIPRCLSVSSDGKFNSVFTLDTAAPDWHVDLSAHAIPGLWDGHGHLLQYGEMLESALLYGSPSIDGR